MKAGKYWDKKFHSYSGAWSSEGKQWLSEKELEFVNFHLRSHKPKRILDIGVGRGRILENYFLNLSSNQEIYGVDFSRSMVDFCQKKFSNQKNFRGIKLIDISKIRLDFKEKFDFVSAIRVLKYNQNWVQIIEKIYQLMNKNGIFVFSMPNKNSITYFARGGIPIYYVSEARLKRVLAKIGFKTLEIKTFSRIPDLFFKVSNNILYVKALTTFENFLSLIFGKTFMGRILLISAQKTKEAFP